MKVKPILNLNKHFDECENYSLVNAKNIKLTKDNIITNDNTIAINNTIKTKLSEKENNNIVGCIPCNTELVIFTSLGHIYRYDEKDNSIDLVIEDFGYNRGKITGTFTYNINNDLIIAFSEHNVPDGKLVPLKTINLNNDTELNNKLFSLAPEVNLPNIKELNYIKGYAYKGWYHVFIRYKINNNDYTNWFNIGYPIFIDKFYNQFIIDYWASRPLAVVDHANGAGAEVYIEDEFSDSKDICDISFMINIDNLDNNYSSYQLGFIISNNDSSKVFITHDINIDVYKYIFDKYSLSDTIISINDIIQENYNFYNVQNTINYKNKLYLSNYKEDIPDHDLLSKLANEICINPISNRTFIEKVNCNITFNNVRVTLTDKKDSLTKTIICDKSSNEIIITIDKIIDAFITKEKWDGTDDVSPCVVISKIISSGQQETYSPISTNSDIENCKLIYNVETKIWFIYDSETNTEYEIQYGSGNKETATFNDVVVLLENRPQGVNSGMSILDLDNILITEINEDNTENESNDIYTITLNNHTFTTKEDNITIPIKEFFTINSYTLIKPIKHNETYVIGQLMDFSNYINVNNDSYIYIENLHKNKKVTQYTLHSDGNTFLININSLTEYSAFVITEYDPFKVRIKRFYNSKLDTFKQYDKNDFIINKQTNNFSIDTLLPNEVYNFFIHYIDKYGNATQGYKINPIIKNATQYELDTQTKYILFQYSDIVYRLKDDYILTNDNKINLPDSVEYCKISDLKYNENNNFTCTNIQTKNRVDLKNILDVFENDKFIGYKWSHVLPSLNYQIFENNNGDRLYKMPIADITKNIIKLHISNIKVPLNYKGFFISYEKIERLTDVGILFKTNYQLHKLSSLIDRKNKKGDDYPIYNDEENDNININYYYSDKLNIEDNININYDIIIYNNNIIQATQFSDPIIGDENGGKKYNSYNKFNYDTNLDINNVRFNIITDSTLQVADDINDNLGNSTKLKIKCANPFISINESQGIEQYFISSVIMCKLNKYLYNNTNKILIKLSDVYYTNNITNDEIYGTIYKLDNLIIDKGYNGKVTHNGVICYNNVLFDDATNVIKSGYTLREYYGNNALDNVPGGIEATNFNPYDHAPFIYIKSTIWDEYFHESKEFNNKPQIKSYIITITKDNRPFENQNIIGTFVTPANSIDLFKNNRNLINYFKTYTNYNSNNWNITNYNNRIIQSNIINSESPINNWRKFNVTEYKDINDNKGKITNLIGIGDLFIVHTEHSMFILDVNNYLIAVNKTVKTEDKELLEINHKEVFTSQVGFGGLQDPNAWIVGAFGYIWYNNDTNRFMRYDNSKFDFIDKSIVNWLLKTKPTNVRFADDKINNRIIISFDVNNTRACISYNYNINAFVSIHGDDDNRIYFDESYNTKNNLYLLKDKALNNITNNVSNSCKISVIVNTEYNIIKYLEFISYKLFTINNKDISVNIYNYSPVEGKSHVYSGDYLTIYNDLVNTGQLDISNNQDNKFGSTLNSDWEKPYFHLGNWNINKLYDTQNTDNTYGFIDNNSRLYGNYFIIEFEFNTDKQFEFEELNCQFTNKIN